MGAGVHTPIMCELLGICANLAVTATLSLDVLARHGGATGPHKDGWGIGYYQGPATRLLKEAEAAADSEWLRFVRDHELRSPIILSHIRKATRGDLTLANTQPFQRELGGHMHLFAHNGNLAGIDALAAVPNRFRPVGETDSEIAFCELMRRLALLWDDAESVPPLQHRYEIVTAFAREIAPMGPANFLYSDGDALFAHGNRRTQATTGEIRPPGLYWLSRQCGVESEFGVDGLRLSGGSVVVTLVASVPLSDEPWQPLDEGEVLCLRAGALACWRVD